MILSLRILAVAFAFLTAGLATMAHLPSSSSGATPWSARAALLLSLGIVVGTTPALLFPTSQWLSITGSLLSLLLTGASFLLLRRVHHADRLTSSDHQLPNKR